MPTDAVLSPCYAFDDTESAACRGQAYDTAPVERVDSTRGNCDQHLYLRGF